MRTGTLDLNVGQSSDPGRPSSRIIDRFRKKAGEASTIGELDGLLQEAIGELGFDHYALLHHASVGSNRADLIRLDSYPTGWEAELVALGLTAEDPVHQASVRTHVGFSWSELGEHVRLGPRQRELLERAASFGIGDGFTVPVNIPGEPSGSCSFAVGPGRSLPLGRLACAEQVGLHAFGAARRIHNLPVACRPPRLSRRELECVKLIAAGKTDWEVAAILGISVETARHYGKRARAAYDVVSRAQLVACGLRDSLVSFDEAIPPNG